jgi:hypothetical protein
MQFLLHASDRCEYTHVQKRFDAFIRSTRNPVIIPDCYQGSLNTILIFAPKTMKYFKVFPYMKTEELLSVLNFQKEMRAFKDWQIIYCVAVNVGKTASDLSVLLGVSKSKIYRTNPLSNSRFNPIEKRDRF